MSLANELAFGRYYTTGSVVHSLDPRVKMVGALGILAAALVTQDPRAYLFLSLSLAAIAAGARLRPGFLLRNLASLRWLVVFVFIVHAFFTPGTPVFDAIPRLTREGALLGGVFAWRIAIMVSAATILTATTSPVELGDGLEVLLGPFSKVGLPVHELAMISVIALRFVPTLMDEATRIVKAQIGRGARFDGGLVARAKSAVPVLVPLFASALNRADDLALAMDARCYRGAAGRTRYIELRLVRRDGLALAAVAAIVLCTIALSN